MINSIFLDSKAAFKSKIICSDLRHPGTSQIKEGMKTNSSCLAITRTSTFSFNFLLISKAAVNPPKLPPITSTKRLDIFDNPASLITCLLPIFWFASYPQLNELGHHLYEQKGCELLLTQFLGPPSL